MPIFSYKCPACSTEVESIEKFDALPKECTCGTTMARQISAPGLFNFKGPGFYENDGKRK